MDKIPLEYWKRENWTAKSCEYSSPYFDENEIEVLKDEIENDLIALIGVYSKDGCEGYLTYTWNFSHGGEKRISILHVFGSFHTSLLDKILPSIMQEEKAENVLVHSHRKGFDRFLKNHGWHEYETIWSLKDGQ